MKVKRDFGKIFQKAQKYLSDGILIFDAKKANYPLIYLNKSVTQITGFSSGELIGKSHVFLKKAEKDKENLKRFNICFSGLKSSNVDLTIIKKDGTKFYSRISVTPVPDEKGYTEYFVCILRDISDARDRLVKKMQLAIVTSTLNTVNDIIFNYMNGVQVFRIQCEEESQAKKELLAEFDKHFQQTLNKLRKINEIKEYKEEIIAEKFGILNYN